MIEPYIKVYVWLLQQKELTALEAILLSKIMQYPNGCWISSRNLGRLCGAHWRTVQKKIVELQRKGWVAVLPNNINGRRYVWATLKDPPAGPLFEYNEKSEVQRRKLEVKNLIYTTAKQMSFW